MKILVDMVHLADVNFFKNALNRLNKHHDITITVLDRGQLFAVVNREYPGFNIIKLGKHRQGKLFKILGLFQRVFKFTLLYIKNKPDVVSSLGFYPAVAAKPFDIRAILFYDDYEYRFIFRMCNRFATRFYIPDSIRTRLSAEFGDAFNYDEKSHSFRKIKFFNGFKETAYLKDFTPDISCLERHKLLGGKFIFCRDIAAVSLNYQQYNHVDLSSSFKWLKVNGYTILYYPEKDINDYDHLCTKLTGAVPDILSLQYYASLTISSGDTIARESALLGTPVIYIGGRNMAVNQPLQEIGLIKVAQQESAILQSMRQMLEYNYTEKMNEKIKTTKWDDVNQVIVNAIEKV